MTTTPFAHDDLELKQHFLGLARELNAKSNTLENELAAALLYMNVADYLAEYLVSGLTEMSKEAVSKYYLGMISMRSTKRDSFNIGDSMKQLEKFDFPRKGDILTELAAINAARKKIAHQMLKTDRLKLGDVDDAVKQLVQRTEELVTLVDEITPGMPPTTIIQRYEEAVSALAEADKQKNTSKSVSRKKSEST